MFHIGSFNHQRLRLIRVVGESQYFADIIAIRFGLKRLPEMPVKGGIEGVEGRFPQVQSSFVINTTTLTESWSHFRQHKIRYGFSEYAIKNISIV